MVNAFPADAMVCFNPDGKVLWAMVDPIANLQALYGKFAATGKYESVTVPGADSGPGLKLTAPEGWSCVFNGNWTDKPSYCARINIGDVIAIRYVTEDYRVLAWSQRPAAAPAAVPITVTETTTVPFTPAREMQKTAEDMHKAAEDMRRMMEAQAAALRREVRELPKIRYGRVPAKDLQPIPNILDTESHVRGCWCPACIIGRLKDKAKKLLLKDKPQEHT